MRLVYFKFFFFFNGNVGKISPESIKIEWVISVLGKTHILDRSNKLELVKHFPKKQEFNRP